MGIVRSALGVVPARNNIVVSGDSFVLPSTFHGRRLVKVDTLFPLVVEVGLRPLLLFEVPGVIFIFVHLDHIAPVPIKLLIPSTAPSAISTSTARVPPTHFPISRIARPRLEQLNWGSLFHGDRLAVNPEELAEAEAVDQQTQELVVFLEGAREPEHEVAELLELHEVLGVPENLAVEVDVLQELVFDMDGAGLAVQHLWVELPEEAVFEADQLDAVFVLDVQVFP